jgi:hypothetical protein
MLSGSLAVMLSGSLAVMLSGSLAVMLSGSLSLSLWFMLSSASLSRVVCSLCRHLVLRGVKLRTHLIETLKI